MKRGGDTVVRLDERDVMQLVSNVQNIFSRLVPYAHHKRELVELLLAHIDDDAMIEYLTNGNVKASYVRQILRDAQGREGLPKELLTQLYPANVTKDRSSAQRLAIETFIADKYSSARSGDTMLSFRLPKGQTKWSAFQQYKDMKGPGAIALFYATAKSMRLQMDAHGTFDIFCCPHCKDSSSELDMLNSTVQRLEQKKLLTVEDWTLLSEARREKKELEFHIQRWKTQRLAYSTSIKNVPEGVLILVIDYATHMLSGDKVPDLIVVGFFLHPVEKVVHHYYLDCMMAFEESPKKDATFLSAVFNEIAGIGMLDAFNSVHIWADTGFRTTGTLYYFFLLESCLRMRQGNPMFIIVNFFAENHGHNVCDQHQGNSSQMITRRIATMSQFDVDMKRKWAMEQLLTMRYTHVLRASPFEISVPPTLSGITKYLAFRFINDGNDGKVECLPFFGAENSDILTFKLNE